MATFKLFLAIFFAILLANLSTAVITWAWVEHAAKVALEEAAKELERGQKLQASQAAADSAERARKNRENAAAWEAQRKERERQALVDQRNREVCAFWKDQYNKTREEHDRQMMITGCKYSGQM